MKSTILFSFLTLKGIVVKMRPAQSLFFSYAVHCTKTLTFYENWSLLSSPGLITESPDCLCAEASQQMFFLLLDFGRSSRLDVLLCHFTTRVQADPARHFAFIAIVVDVHFCSCSWRSCSCCCCTRISVVLDRRYWKRCWRKEVKDVMMGRNFS